MKLWRLTLSTLPLALLVSSPAWAGSGSSYTGSGFAAQLTPSRLLVSAQYSEIDEAPKLIAASSQELVAQELVAQTPATSYSWAMILEKYVNATDETGLATFNYGSLHAHTKDREALDQYVASLESADTKAMSEPDVIAYWANLYNAVTIKVVIDNYPVDSIRDIRSGFRAGPWKRDLVTVDGKDLSLDDIEHKILRKKYPSPLVHYMVNCASIGCPNLKASPWEAVSLDADREAAARAFINSPRGVKITEKGLKVSSIYKWFKEDFGGNNAGVLAHLREYADEDLANAIDGGAKIIGDTYNWSLNE